MTWLLLTQDFPPGFIGGIASWVEDLASALHGAGHDVTVLCRATPGTRGHDEQRPYRIVRMMGRSWNRFQGTWARLHVARFLAPDVHVVAATWRLATKLVHPVAKAGARLFVAFHGSDLTRARTAERGLSEVAHGAHRLLPVSAFLKRELERLVPDVPADRLRILPMPLPIPLAPGSGPRAGLLLVARLGELKGIDRAIRLAAAVGEELAIVGDGDRSSLPDAPHVTWMGRKTRDELAALYATRRAVVLLPRRAPDGSGAEGLGLCLLEGASHGAIPIGCRTGGVPEALGPGILVDDPDAPDGAQIRRRLEEPGLGAECHAWVRDRHGPLRTLSVLGDA